MTLLIKYADILTFLTTKISLNEVIIQSDTTTETQKLEARTENKAYLKTLQFAHRLEGIKQ